MSESKWYLRTQDETFGPETEAKLVEWAKLGRIQPGQEISDDNVIWRRVEDVPFLDMRFSIDIGDGNPRGPFNKAAAEALLASGRLPSISKLVETRPPFEEVVESSNRRMVESIANQEEVVESTNSEVVEKIVEKEVIKEVPVEVIKEVPVEKIVEKVVEKEVIKEVPVEVIKEVEKIVVDETRVKELEGLLAEERRHTAELQTRMDETSRNASEAAKAATERESELKAKLREEEDRAAKLEAGLRDAADRENKYAEQVRHLEDELRRLPQAASEVADIQAAMYSIMTGEVADLAAIIEAEKKEFEECRRRYQERAERLAERRREILKRSGGNIEEMTHKALIARPEDPRTIQLRKDLDELRAVHERVLSENDKKIRELTEKLRLKTVEETRSAESLKDITQLRQEVESLHEQLQAREKELVDERQRSEELQRQQATRQQTLMARLASLESPSIGTAQTMETNQSREARQVKLPGWMRLGK